MAILHLPDEPDTPAGKAIQAASEPRAISDKFMMVFKSDPHLGDTIRSVNLNLAISEVTFVATETGDYKWIDWLIKVPEGETVTLFLLDDEGKHRCVMVMEELYVFEHTCPVSNNHNQYGIDSPYELEHKVIVQFANIERLSQHKQSISSSK